MRVKQQKADQVDRLDQIFLDLAVANLPGDAAAPAPACWKTPG